MVRKKFIAFLFSFFFFSTVHASLNGDWLGFGTWKFKGQGEGVRCSPMRMRWSETPSGTFQSIAIEGGLFECEIVDMELGRLEWKVRDGKLVDENNAVVGSYDGTDFEVLTPSPNENTTIHIRIHREANHFDYRETWFNKYEKVYVIEGRFFTGH